MIVSVLGKKSFHSEKKNTDYFVLAISYPRNDYKEGVSVAEKFVPENVYRDVLVGKNYEMLCDFNGFVQSVEAVEDKK